ncbi:hypothetical protein FRC04_003596 [Tulasnella sp. 424]|nr:hypothetical protein FRC04_003596 [Tulasnella sp. 424]
MAGSGSEVPSATTKQLSAPPSPRSAPSAAESKPSGMDEDQDQDGEEADIEALLLPLESRVRSPLIGPHDLPPVPSPQHEQLKEQVMPGPSRPSVASNSQAAPTAGLPLDIAAILDMVTISGQQPQHTLPVGQSAEGGVSQKAASEDAGSSSATEPTQAAAADVNAESSDSSSSDWDSSESDDEEQSRQPSRPSHPSKLANSDDEDEDLGGKTTSGPLKTTNEVVDPDVAPPSIERVGDDEILEIVGEVMSVIGSVVVVKGQPGSGVEKVLDTGSLLVWDDRHVLGEVFETFGPTHLPLYSIRLPSSPSKSIFTVGRRVYHIPARSNYVFTRSLALIKGSDASNQHDEEVGEDEIEFSDDEKEIEWKKQKKMKRQGSVRPSPRAGDDGDWEYSSSSAYYDPETTFGGPPSSTAGPSTPRRAAPAPYDESMGLPYEDQDISAVDDDGMSVTSSVPEPSYGRGRGFSRGRSNRGRGARDRGRGRGRGARGGFRGGMPPPPPPSFNQHNHSHPQFGGTPTDEYDPRTSNSENFNFSFPPAQQQTFGFGDPAMAMGMGMMPNFAGGGGAGHVAHFNPNFFPGMMMGMNMGAFGPMGMGWNFGGGMGGQGSTGYWPGQDQGGQNDLHRGSHDGQDGDSL